MPEATKDAVFLIATSYQALGRVVRGDEQTMTCNCTVVLVFAAFYIEANLTNIIKEMGVYDDFKDFVPSRFPGMYPKLSWFFTTYVKPGLATSKSDFHNPKFATALYKQFSGFEEIHDFRNGVAHGDIDLSKANSKDALRLRDDAKKIVAGLFKIAENAGHKIKRAITYQIAVSPDPDSEDA